MSRSWVLLLATAGLWAQQSRDLHIEAAAPQNTLRDRGTRWAVVVGVSSYQYLPPAAQLHFAHRDAEEFAGFLRSAAGGAIPGNQIRLLTNERATLAALRGAIHTWLAESARPEDVVYVFFAGHGVVDDQNEGYFVAYDSDPQNLHATGLSFQEVDRTLSGRMRASMVVMVADACHTGRLGWSSYSPDAPSRTLEPLAMIGQGDRSFLKLLSTSASESSFEDQRWDGGHGVFTHSLLQGLRGEADGDGDHVVRASEAIDYVSRIVPGLTGAKQHPRVAGTFDARAALAMTPNSTAAQARGVPLDVAGPANSAVYLDSIFRGRIRPTGGLRIEPVMPGPHAFSADFADGTTLDGTVTLGASPARVSIVGGSTTALGQLRGRIEAGRVIDPGGAWDFYRANTFPAAERPAATALISGALEEVGQACIGDYVQSTATGLKGVMLQRAARAYELLEELHPRESGYQMRKLFCRGRLEIAQGKFAEAVETLEQTLKLDPGFACSYNALGVALSRLNRQDDARKAFEYAAKLTPEWALPPYQIAAQLIARGDVAKAIPYLEKAVRFNPSSIAPRYTLIRAQRLRGSAKAAEQEALDLIRVNPNYAPVYVELGLLYEAGGDLTKATEAYDKYLLLAPNFADSSEVRTRAEKIRPRPSRKKPSLQR